jgi:hypothetical protein
MFAQYEDSERLDKMEGLTEAFSPYQDFRLYPSSVTPGIQLGMNVIKPENPGLLLIQLHGWHMSMPKPQRRDVPNESTYLIVQVDMRGRAFSQGSADCNGNELVDIYDAVQFVRQEYKDWLLAEEPAYLEGGSGGGGNVLATVAKFPDLFAAASALYGMSDYADWYEQDQTGEFRDEMDVWIGCTPQDDMERYQARSGLHLATNVQTPLYITHGDGDIRVPVTHSRIYVKEMQQLNKGQLVRYDELAGVGDQGHLAHIRPEQSLRVKVESERNRSDHPAPIQLPLQGRLLVGGYVYTKYFKLQLDSVNHLAEVTYDVERREVRLTASAEYPYHLQWADGAVMSGCCVQRANE